MNRKIHAGGRGFVRPPWKGAEWVSSDHKVVGVLELWDGIEARALNAGKAS
jgi:hypothetical protein